MSSVPGPRPERGQRWTGDVDAGRRERARRADRAEVRRRREEARQRVLREFVAGLEALGGPLTIRLTDEEREALRAPIEGAERLTRSPVPGVRPGHAPACADLECPGWPCVLTTGQAPPRGRA